MTHCCEAQFRISLPLWPQCRLFLPQVSSAHGAPPLPAEPSQVFRQLIREPPIAHNYDFVFGLFGSWRLVPLRPPGPAHPYEKDYGNGARAVDVGFFWGSRRVEPSECLTEYVFPIFESF